MNRASLRAAALKVSPLKEEYVAEVCREFFNVLTDFLAQGRTVELRGSFTLAPIWRAGRPARNPRTNEPVWIAPHKTVRAVFPARKWKRRVTVYPKRIEAVREALEPFYAEV